MYVTVSGTPLRLLRPVRSGAQLYSQMAQVGEAVKSSVVEPLQPVVVEQSATRRPTE